MLPAAPSPQAVSGVGVVESNDADIVVLQGALSSGGPADNVVVGSDVSRSHGLNSVQTLSAGGVEEVQAGSPAAGPTHIGVPRPDGSHGWWTFKVDLDGLGLAVLTDEVNALDATLEPASGDVVDEDLLLLASVVGVELHNHHVGSEVAVSAQSADAVLTGTDSVDVLYEAVVDEGTLA